MPRRPRLRIANQPLHVMQRGNNRSACFFTESDYLVYLHDLADLADRMQCRIHAYVLMTNHVHLLLTPAGEAGASALMKRLGQRYVQYVNRRYGRSGSLWEGRFRSSLVETETYFLCCQRYIELNPVRAGMVSSPAHYRWSSHGANALGRRDPLVSPHAQYLALGADDGARLRAYRALFDAEVQPQTIAQIRSAANGGYALGSSKFEAELALELGRPVARRPTGRPPRKPGTDHLLD
jgi:putative transposase